MRTQIVIRPQGSGKTRELLAWLRTAPKGEERVVVVHDAHKQEHLRRTNPDVEAWRIQTCLGSVRHALRAFPVNPDRVVVAVDDVEMVLSLMLGAPVVLVTATEFKA